MAFNIFPFHNIYIYFLVLIFSWLEHLDCLWFLKYAFFPIYQERQFVSSPFSHVADVK